MTEPNLPTVLVVDDDHDLRRNLERLLGARGLKVLQAASGEEALEVLDHECCHVLVLDQRMGGICGVDTMRLIKERGHDVEVIFLTGHASADDAVEGIQLGARDYLLKPVSTDLLHAKILTAWERRRERLRC